MKCKQVQITYLENVLNILFIHWYNSLKKSMNNINILCNISILLDKLLLNFNLHISILIDIFILY